MDRFRRPLAGQTQDTIARLPVQVIDDTHEFDGDDGTRWWSVGSAPVIVDTDGEHHFMPLGESLCAGRVLYCKVAGVQHYGNAIANQAFAVGSTTALIAEPDNEYDSSAVGVWDARGQIQVGHIPADYCADIAEQLSEGERLVGYVLREIRRDSQSGPRTGIHLLVAPAGQLALVRVDQ